MWLLRERALLRQWEGNTEERLLRERAMLAASGKRMRLLQKRGLLRHLEENVASIEVGTAVASEERMWLLWKQTLLWHLKENVASTEGWFAGRNLAVSQVTTKYFLWVDDDFVFLNETRIESFVNIMEAVPELDVIGGQVESNQFSFKLQYEEGSSEEGGCITRVSGTHAPTGFEGCFFADGSRHYVLGRTEAGEGPVFDPFLKRVGHTGK
ncbi:beta-1,4 N-acetylgalactosaminyltransferase 2-like protein [Labeo rohita]|uniref:Beta-1,4 N-acetylgalactosaminyltransferase 2-like protein n=1 Tax=Labeo rohita TaxID=84645 RepID=A0A498NHC3_LABRO|nr:beta-1,4 N-acetylgalactosaminyltransferase 2-like protein [Labeo rohita]